MASSADDGVSVFSVAPNTGRLTSVFNIDDASDSALELDGASSVTTAVVGTTTYLFVASSADDGVSVFSVGANTGTMTSVFNIDDASDSALELDGASSVTTAVVGTTTYLFVAGSADDGVSVFSVGANTGRLTSVFNIDDASDRALELDGASSVTTAVVGTTTYLFVAGSADDGVSVFSVGANTGRLTSVFNIDDASDRALELDGASSVTTAVVGTTTYLFVAASADDGVSIFSVDPNTGTLTSVANIADTSTLNLDGAAAVTTAVVGTTTYLFVAGLEDNGVSSFSLQ